MVCSGIYTDPVGDEALYESEGVFDNNKDSDSNIVRDICGIYVLDVAT